MLTDIIRDRIVTASAEVNRATDHIRDILRGLAGPQKTDAIPPNAKVNPSETSISKALDSLEAELEALHRELLTFRDDEPQPEQETARIGTRR
jgi:hypothetical protein